MHKYYVYTLVKNKENINGVLLDFPKKLSRHHALATDCALSGRAGGGSYLYCFLGPRAGRERLTGYADSGSGRGVVKCGAASVSQVEACIQVFVGQ